MGEVEAGMERTSAITTQVKVPVGVACSLLQELPKSQERDGS